MRRRRAVLGLVAALAVAPMAFAGDARVVIVAGAQSTIRSIAPADVRRMFLGLPIVVDGAEVAPLCNLADTRTHEVFLQKVLFMSAQAYERRMLGKVYREGGSRLREFESSDALLQALLANPRGVTYMLHDAAVATPGVRIVAEP